MAKRKIAPKKKAAAKKKAAVKSKAAPKRKAAKRRLGPEDYNARAKIKTQRGYYNNELVEFTVIDGWAILDGDMVIGRASKIPKKPPARTRAIIRTDRPPWPGAKVYYKIHPSLPDKNRITKAIKQWEANTRLRFFPRTNQANYIEVIPASGCWSAVGMQGGKQQIGLSSACSMGNTIHEIGHAIGLWHEQSREDRDNWVTVDFGNIIPNRIHNFDKHVVDGKDVNYYDYRSIMHYNRTAFSRNGRATIVPKVAGIAIGQRTRLSLGDILGANYMYPGQAFYIRSRLNGLVLDIKGESTADGAPIITWPRKTSGNLKNQLWEFTSEGYIKSKLNGHVIGTKNNSGVPGTPVCAYKLNPSGLRTQRWSVQSTLNNQSIQWAFAASLLNGLVLDIAGANPRPRGKVIIWPRKRSGTENQEWELLPQQRA